MGLSIIFETKDNFNNSNMKHFIGLVFAFFLIVSTFAQDVMYQPWYWQFTELVGGKTLATRLAEQSAYLEGKGFTHIWLPPLSVSSSGGSSMGYNPMDLYDIGQYASKTRAGKRQAIDQMIDSFAANNLKLVGDMVYNHRDGGKPEDNPAVEGWIENLNNTKITAGEQPYPSDRYRCYLPLGGSTGNGVGKYYLKIASASKNSKFYGKTYKVFAWTRKSGSGSAGAASEVEPNGGGDCSQSNDTLLLRQVMTATIDNGGCGVDEFMLELTADDFNAAGDSLWITLTNDPGGLSNYTDHFIYGIWYTGTNSDIQSQLKYQTYTDFSTVKSGRGQMNYMHFKPNGNPTNLGGDWDAMLFFYDYDHSSQATRDSLFAWTRWMYDSLGIGSMRLDAVKHFPPSFVGDLLDYLVTNNIDPGLVVGEFFDYNAASLKGWVDAVRASMDPATKTKTNPRLFDFALRLAMKDACDNSNYDVRNLFGAGMVHSAGATGFDVVTFLDNHDTDHEGNSVVNHPELAYAYMLTNNRLGLPCIFEKDYGDYGTVKNGAIRGKINALMDVHRKYIFGANQVIYLNNFSGGMNTVYTAGSANRSLIYQVRGGAAGKDVLVAINFGDTQLSVTQTIDNVTSPAGTKFTDVFQVSGNAFATVNGSSQIALSVPARSFGVWVQGEVSSISLTDSTYWTVGEDVSVKVPANRLSLMPNPANDLLLVSLENALTETAVVEVLDLAGRVLLRETLAPGQTENSLNISQLSAGSYWVRVLGQPMLVARLVKE